MIKKNARPAHVDHRDPQFVDRAVFRKADSAAFVFDDVVDRVVLDAFCPWAGEFTFTQDDRVMLRKSVVDEGNEARKRASIGSDGAAPDPE